MLYSTWLDGNFFHVSYHEEDLITFTNISRYNTCIELYKFWGIILNKNMYGSIERKYILKSWSDEIKWSWNASDNQDNQHFKHKSSNQYSRY